MIEVMADVNFWLDACRFRDTFADAVTHQNDRMGVIQVVKNLGSRSGIRIHTGAHVISNVRTALRRQEVSNRGVTRNAWNTADIEAFVAFVTSTVAASGGRTDVATVSHDAACDQAQLSGAPDGEDHQVLILAVNSGATVLATNDVELLQMGTFAGVEIWASTEIDAEVSANVRRLRAEAFAR